MFFVYLSALILLLGAELTSEWPRAVETLRRGEDKPGPSFGAQVRGFVRGLWFRDERRDGGGEDGSSGG